MDSANIQVGIGESDCVTIGFTKNLLKNLNMTPNIIIVRINDRNGNFDYQPECDTTNNVMSFANPYAMKKEATLMITPEFKHDGTYANPVSVLYNEQIKYEITAVNGDTPGSVVITDTIPPYLKYVPGSATPKDGTALIDSTKVNDENWLKWTFSSVPSKASRSVSFRATPVGGAVASQPLFINHAWVQASALPQIRTNGTFHQGAGISIMTFSASYGGSIYNANEQALDYMTTPRSGILVVPDEGYAFAGWSHDSYTSLRGATVKAQEGIMLYDTLTVYGNVELHANFVPVEASLNDEQEEGITTKSLETEDKVWAAEDELFISTTKPGSIVRIYTLDGNLFSVRSIVSPGLSKIKLPRGIYIVTISNKIGRKVRIE